MAHRSDESEISQAVAVLKSQMQSLIGNGQPGRMDKVERQLDKHNWMIAVGFGVLIAVQFLAANDMLRFVAKH